MSKVRKAALLASQAPAAQSGAQAWQRAPRPCDRPRLGEGAAP